MLVSLALLAGCGALDAGLAPRVEAHRCGAGYYPQNSRAACTYALDQGYDALEFDLVLTKDEVPVIAHDPWMDPERCTTADGGALDLEEKILLKDLTLAEVQSGYLCGGPADPDWPDAEKVAETIMTWDELRVLLAAHPDVLAHIDVKWEAPYTVEPEVYARAILEPWWADDLPNPYYVSGFQELVAAVEALGDEAGQDPETSITWPYFPAEGNDVLTALGHEFMQLGGVTDLVQTAEDAGADGVNVAWQVADRRKIEAAEAAGVPVQLWTINDAAQLEAFGKWPVASLISDVPGEAP